ncbi:hypothetical protein GYMLUDRAFT_64665 [Collybiopsis luxurians FD-317 M1]|uniref:Zn(2)-C6 fungal-type domain-containing protein n=1 Tax=Collybiopsis luxurians FD-317 M1 TaxID=944289 RepID=A0A0D0C1P2_9AGAR|nr:hypothetical protein GYMLUDRAFT_64665 [Collybiopsis luxurians FD-317 M1]
MSHACMQCLVRQWTCMGGSSLSHSSCTFCLQIALHCSYLLFGGDHHPVNSIPPPVTEEDGRTMLANTPLGKLTDIIAELAATSASLQEQAMLLHNLQENYANGIH